MYGDELDLKIIDYYYQHLQHTEDLRFRYLSTLLALNTGGILFGDNFKCVNYLGTLWCNYLWINFLLFILSISGYMIADKYDLVIKGYSNKIFYLVAHIDPMLKPDIPKNTISIGSVYMLIFLCFSSYFFIKIITLMPFDFKILLSVIFVTIFCLINFYNHEQKDRDWCCETIYVN